ncbi:hypothetical protein AK812_SmicGene4597 [Symbiodinium microadriaticum]|uniref:Uncharacterized protein n=1 Tax=Symbiodinium microadriaticum TaxID=2951 RepID=A0A1Q9EVY7_SYMMI|nr:hypothetical protein AK812_SmicGene4597 [Symbiodinium microadriaticum]
MSAVDLIRLQNMHSDEPPRALEEIQDELYLQEQAAIKIQGTEVKKREGTSFEAMGSQIHSRSDDPSWPVYDEFYTQVFCRECDRNKAWVFESIMDATVLERRERNLGFDVGGMLLLDPGQFQLVIRDMQMVCCHGSMLANSVVMLLELELEGQDIGRSPFLFAFLGEWLIRLVLMKCEFWKVEGRLTICNATAPSERCGEQEMANWFDTALVFAGLADAFWKHIVVVAWALADGDATSRLLGLLMSMGSLFLGLLALHKLENLLQDPIADEAMQWLWSRYGTAYRSTYTLFEITFAGNWPTFDRNIAS